ncbi:MAG TPA: hypothetical protein VLI41_01545 [Phenylobacterium sp.]|uniref:hypothetical protein n=1 Tax=Phenylobacterium sp. TaxID=1871053 RepID=UPI002C9E9447|nr:hypothetical protein [Phenylobacterium sp.]HSV01863.1 hypothetical protein [Phenylobacterium sp.]
MADGELTVRLDDATLRRLHEAAAAAGEPIEVYAAEVLARSAGDRGYEEDLRLVAEYQASGVSHSVEEGLAGFDAAVKVRLAGEP